MSECFNCARPTTERYTLILSSDSVLEDHTVLEELVCQECIVDFRNVEWIEVRESPVLMRGGNDTSTDEDNLDE